MPRKEKKPTTSVTVVRMIDEAVAGSCPKRRNSTGDAHPLTLAKRLAQIVGADQVGHISARAQAGGDRHTAHHPRVTEATNTVARTAIRVTLSPI